MDWGMLSSFNIPDATVILNSLILVYIREVLMETQLYWMYNNHKLA